MATLIYKIENDPYYSDFAIDCDALNLFPTIHIGISNLLQTIKEPTHNTT